ncbi:GNAT family N-acetyltransferase [Lysobacter hankyongensis]|uniref:N-acetyltransferase domain-containing protein n=1 Tax=Lysobacter hankyongensis TaxID=1176535 RepID=A0ABP9AK23_9GAMM
MPRLIFRRAVPADVPAMSALRLSVKENKLSDPLKVTPQMYLDFLERDGCGWVCEDGIGLAGFAYANRLDASVWALFVDPRCEGLGIGTRLLASVTDWLFELGNDRITLTTSAETRADAFYRARGWHREGPDVSGDVTFTLVRRS